MVEEPKTPKAVEEPKTLNMVEESEEPPKPKRGRPKKAPVPKPEPKKRGRPKQVTIDETPQVASFDSRSHNEQLLQAFIAHNSMSKIRQREQWSSLVRF